MANGHGGRRPGAGKPRGAKTLVTQEAIKRAGEGETPLEYMLRVMRDPRVKADRRDKMALGAASYMHPKLNTVQHEGSEAAPIVHEIRRSVIDSGN